MSEQEKLVASGISAIPAVKSGDTITLQEALEINGP